MVQLDTTARERMQQTNEHAALADMEIVQRVLGGETALFELLMRRHNPRLFRVTRAILKDDSEAEDAMQEAYVKAYFQLQQFEGRAQFSTWLTRIAVHEALQRLRKDARLRLVATNEEPSAEEQAMADDGRSSDTGPEAALRDHELQRLLEVAIDALPVDYRTVLVMRDVEGLSTEETAECLGISETLAKVRLHRARASLKSMLERTLQHQATHVYEFLRPRCDRIVAAVLGRIVSQRSSG